MELLRVILVAITILLAACILNKNKVSAFHQDYNIDVEGTTSIGVTDHNYDYDGYTLEENFETTETTEENLDGISQSITEEVLFGEDDNCTGTLTYLHFNSNTTNKELEVSWDSNPSHRCFYEYKITKTEMSSTQTRVTQSVNINKTSYTFDDLKPCTKYNITVEMFLENTKDILAKKTENFETDSIVFNQVENLNISPSTNEIRLSWNAPKYADLCKIRYKIYASKEIPYYRYVKETEHWIKNLHSCTEYKISVTPSSMVRDETDGETSHFIEHTVNTLPQAVQNLNLEFYNNKSIISWLPPEDNECITEYMIQKSNNNWAERVSANSAFLERNENLFCTEITVTPITKDTAIGESASLLKPGRVQRLISSLITNSMYITIEWEPPENEDCVYNYVLYLDVIFISSTNGNETTYTFEDLTSCTLYMLGVAANSSTNTLGEIELINVTTSYPEEIGKVQNLKYEYIEEYNQVNITWEAPANAESCRFEYLLEIFNNEIDEAIYNETILETHHLVQNISWTGCAAYVIRVTAVIESTEGQISETPLEIQKVTLPPICKKQMVEKTSVSIECKLNPIDENLCPRKEITVECNASKEKNNGSWVIWDPDNITQDISKQLDVFYLDINGLSEFTNYTCVGKILNSAGYSETSKPEGFQTAEGVPDAPHLEVKPSGSRSISMKWKEPENIRGILTGYTITINTKGPQYLIPNIKECSPKNVTIPPHFELPSSNSYMFVGALPKYEYEISIQAHSRDGGGETSTLNVSTLSETPEQPRDVDFNITVIEKNYNVSVDVVWSYPCHTYGPVKYFEIYFHGVSTVDFNNTNHTDVEIVIPINEDNENLNYNYIIPNLRPAFNYTINISIIPEGEDLFKNPALILFTTPESIPEAPIINESTITTKDGITFTWAEPPHKNGKINSYTLNVINGGPMYTILSDEDCDRSLRNYSYEISHSENNFVFQDGKPYHSYKASVIASTSAGDGEPSKFVEAQTMESEPEEVRQLSMKVDHQKVEIYKVSLTVTFKYPCNMNGLFEKFILKMVGNRPNYPSHTNEINLEDMKLNYQIEFNDIQPEYNYTIHVTTNSKNHESRTSELRFSSPSGVPPETESIIAPIPFDTTKANYTLDRNLFDIRFGEILYYALIVGTEDKNEKSKYGFWEGDETSWPVIIQQEGELGPYQSTSDFWNPFLDFEDKQTDYYVFILGDSDLSEYNKPLEPGIVYTLKVRGFTRHGYRDSPTVKFKMPAVINLSLILGLVFGIIGTGILLSLICIFWRRRQQWNRKKETIKSIPLTPMPVSIKKFPNHYMKLKNSSEKLKQEFTLLGTMSNEMAISASDGLLPENKKKNRYTNIIPYDQTRVKLVDINDNLSTSDYINASYIQGYSNNIEYIATQGPLEHTCMDFWKMVIQENSSLIVMVAQFVEQNKDKCYKYFPNNHENMELENGISIRCCTELDFKTHIVRTLLVQKDLNQWTITHLQFTNWPDFGCPPGSDVILEFCQIMREHAEKNSDPIVIHCSAGVGRTGTLIALDILLQAIHQNQDIDIFGTVLNLRRDRKNMVQTEKQYLFIHTSVNDALENPLPLQSGDDNIKEPIYENVNDIKREYENMDESKF